MARDRTARTRIRNFLVTQGPVDDPSGHATSTLAEAIAYQGSSVAFIQLIAAMDRDGEIVREIKGKRTYRIAAGKDLVPLAGLPVLSGTSGAPGADRQAGLVQTDAGTVTIDYDKLARALVRELWAFVTETVPAGTAAGSLEAAELVAERERLVAERNEYARRLQLARTKLDELLGAAVTPSEAGVTA